MESNFRSILALLISAVWIFLTAGIEVNVRFPHVNLDSTGKCRLPDVFDFQISRPLGSGAAWDIRLQRNTVVTSSGFVYVLRNVPGQGLVAEVEALGDEHPTELEGYHNNSMGASFIIRCTVDAVHGKIYSMEGTLYTAGKKFQLTPVSWMLHRVDQSPDHVTVNYHMQEVEEYNAADASAALDSPHMQVVGGRTYKQQTTAKRVKRESDATYYIDVLPFTDHSVFQRWQSLYAYNSSTTRSVITNYLAGVYTSVNMRLETLNLAGRKIKVQMLSPVFSEDAASSPWSANIKEYEGTEIKYDATRLLAEFKKYLLNASGLPQYDHAMLFVANDIYGGSDEGIRFNVTKGLAYVSTICKPAESSSIIEDKGAYQSEGVAAHELGHSLGSKHDGQDNNCNSMDRFLMSDTNYPASSSNQLNPWRFSSCSSAAILSNLEQLETNTAFLNECLKKTLQGSIAVNSSTVKTTNDQCIAFYGNTSFTCRGGIIPSFDTVCDEFYCRVPKTGLCERMTAAEGTCCKNKKSCRSGVCDGGADQCNMDDTCPLGDQPGIVLNGQTCEQLSPAYCYGSDIALRCCQKCKKQEQQINNPDCKYGDKVLGCLAQNCDKSNSDGTGYNISCCATCKGPPLTDYVTISVDNSGTFYTCPELVNKSKSYCYQPVINSKACVKTCEGVRNKELLDCQWGDRLNCAKFLSSLTPGYICTADQKYNCCKSCADVAITTTVATTTTTTTKAPSSSVKQPSTLTMSSTPTPPIKSPTPATSSTTIKSPTPATSSTTIKSPTPATSSTTIKSPTPATSSTTIKSPTPATSSTTIKSPTPATSSTTTKSPTTTARITARPTTTKVIGKPWKTYSCPDLFCSGSKLQLSIAALLLNICFIVNFLYSC